MFTYDAMGRLLEAVDFNQTPNDPNTNHAVLYTYDDFSRVTSEAQGRGGRFILAPAIPSEAIRRPSPRLS